MKPETYSNIAYLFLAVAWALSGHYLLAGYATILALTSAYSHHTKDWLPDWSAMYMIFAGILLHQTGLPVWIAFLVFPITYFYPRYFVNNYLLIGVLTLGVILLSPNAGLTLLLFLSALGIRQVGEKYYDWYQPLHSVWHVLTAISFYFLI
jgi:hypothetical protein